MANKREILKKGLNREKFKPEEPEVGEQKEKESARERIKEKPAKPEKEVGLREEAESSAVTKVAAPGASAKEPILRQIEDILAEDLEDVYLGMSPQKRQEFKLKGEETASKIKKLMEKVKVNTRKVVNLIKKWLKLITKVNKYFLEQESKIKADRVMKIRNKKEE